MYPCDKSIQRFSLTIACWCLIHYTHYTHYMDHGSSGVFLWLLPVDVWYITHITLTIWAMAHLACFIDYCLLMSDTLHTLHSLYGPWLIWRVSLNIACWCLIHYTRYTNYTGHGSAGVWLWLLPVDVSYITHITLIIRTMARLVCFFDYCLLTDHTLHTLHSLYGPWLIWCVSGFHYHVHRLWNKLYEPKRWNVEHWLYWIINIELTIWTYHVVDQVSKKVRKEKKKVRK